MPLRVRLKRQVRQAVPGRLQRRARLMADVRRSFATGSGPATQCGTASRHGGGLVPDHLR
jgi:hypothetical protein